MLLGFHLFQSYVFLVTETDMRILFQILAVLPFFVGLALLRWFHGVRTDDEGVPQPGYERSVFVAEALIAAVLAIGFVMLIDAPSWAAFGFAVLGLYIQDVKRSIQLSIRKWAVHRA